MAPPTTFRPAPEQRAWLLAYARILGCSQSALLRALVAEASDSTHFAARIRMRLAERVGAKRGRDL